jgi:transcription elongation factor Elf1
MNSNPKIIPTRFVCQAFGCNKVFSASRKEVFKISRLKCPACGGSRLEPTDSRKNG